MKSGHDSDWPLGRGISLLLWTPALALALMALALALRVSGLPAGDRPAARSPALRSLALAALPPRLKATKATNAAQPAATEQGRSQRRPH